MVSLVHLGIIICPELYSEPPQCVKDSDFGTRVGGALVKWPKYFFLPIAIKLASIIENGVLIIYHQGQKKFKRVKKVDFTSETGFHAK